MWIGQREQSCDSRRPYERPHQNHHEPTHIPLGCAATGDRPRGLLEGTTMKGRMVVLKGLIIFVIFVAVWLILDAITGDGISSANVLNAVISGVIFMVLYWVFDYIVAKRKSRS